MLKSTLSFLLGAHIESKGWGYQQGQGSIVEPTAAVLIYLNRHPEAADVVQSAVEWLVKIQHADGGWGINEHDLESGWQTAWAILALKRCSGDSKAIEAGIQWLVSVDTMQLQDSELLAVGERVAKIDFSLRGWPWLPGEASWVEPTALSILALHAAGEIYSDQSRLGEAIRYLVDRRCSGGGWNVGNPVMFDALLPARAVPTSLSLLALQKAGRERITSDDLNILRQEIEDDGGLLAAAWGLLTLKGFGNQDQGIQKVLANAQDPDGGWAGNPYITAISAMALEGNF